MSHVVVRPTRQAHCVTPHLDEATSVTLPLPFPEFEADAESSRYTAPTWVRANPRRRPARVRHPTPVATTAVAGVYDALLAALDPEDDVARDVGKWAQQAATRLAEAVRVHVGDVDAVVCGSLASGAHVATAQWDVDICVQAHAGRPGWDRDPNAALDDVSRWITAIVGVSATVDQARNHIRIHSAGGLPVDVIVAWATPNKPGGFVCARPGRSDLELIPCAPAMHSDRVRARDALLGRDGAFLKVIRIAKHVTRRWAALQETTPLNSFEVDVLALEVLTQPFDVAEGVAFLFRHAAELVRQPVPCALAPGGRFAVTAPEVAEAFLCDAAARSDEAMFAIDADSAVTVLGEAFAA